MPAAFKTNPLSLHDLLKDCRSGKLQLPDFQRSWVWDEERIRSLIASVSRAFPIGALMTLETGGEVDFKPRPIEGAPDEAKGVKPDSLLLDGQQRMTSLYQVTLRGEVVETVTTKKKRVSRWFYIDIRKALDPSVDREDAIISVPPDKRLTEDFGREVILDVSTHEREFETLMYPVASIFDWDKWQKAFIGHSMRVGDFEEKWAVISAFKEHVLDNIIMYHVPVIALDRATPKEAVCVVFEKVNTGGKPLDAFELVTAMYAADGHELRRDWYGKDGEVGRHQRFVNAARHADSDRGIISEVASTDFLQGVSLFHTRDKRSEAAAAGKQGRELPQIIASRQALLNLPLDGYLRYQNQVERGFMEAAKFLNGMHIYRVFDLPYQSQVVPLAAILSELGDRWHSDTIRQKLAQWYWNGVFGELYGSTTETRFARDFAEAPAWVLGEGDVPTTIRDATFRAERLETMRMRLSAAYKGVNALLMKEGAEDFRSGQKFDLTVFFGENVDIHHIFPKKWCDDNQEDPKIYDSIINKTPLSYRTNRIIGGAAPSAYLAKLEAGAKEWDAVEPERLDGFLRSHLIEPDLLRADDFDGFMRDRQEKLLRLIESAMGHAVYRGDEPEEGEDAEEDEDAAEAHLTITVNGGAQPKERPAISVAAQAPGGQPGTAEAPSPERSQDGLDVRRFWQHMIERHPKERGDGRATAEGTRWHVLDDLDLVVSLTMGSRIVRVFVRGEAEAKASLVQKRLRSREDELAQALGVPMNSEEHGRFFISRLNFDLVDEANWDAATDWLFEQAETYEAALTKYLKGPA